MYNLLMSFPSFKNAVKSFNREFFSISNGRLFIIVSLSLVIIFSPIFIQQKPFYLFNDQVVQYNIFYKEWLRLVNSFLNGGSYPFYSWYKFLGSDFFSSSAYYTVGDIFLPLLLQFKNVETALLVETILLVYISAFSFRYFLKKFGLINEISLFIVPYVYALNGLVGLYLGNYMFHRFYAFLPLLFAGVELYIQKNRVALFTLSVSLLYLQSFYFMFPISLFLAIYVLFSYSIKDKKIFHLDFVKSNLKLIVYYLLGFGLVAVLLVPTIFAILQSPRLQDVQLTQWFFPLKTWIGMVFSFASGPFPIITNIPNIFQVGLDGHMFWYSFYISSTFLAILIHFLLSPSKSRKHFLILLSTILTIILFLPLNSIFHGFAEPTVRLSILFVFFMLLTVAYALQEFSFEGIRKAYVRYLFVLIILSVLSLIVGYINLKTHWIHISVLILFLLIGLIGNTLFKKKEMLVGFIVIEVILNLTLHVYVSNRVFYSFGDNLIQDYMDYYQEIDPDLLFRTYVDPKQFLPSTSLNLNQSMVYSYMSVSSYDSFYEPNLKDFLHLNGIDWHIIHITNPDVLKMLGVKYYIAYQESEIPKSVHYEYATTINHLKVYKDTEYLPIGFTYSSFEALESVKGTYTQWLDTALLYESDLRYVNDISATDRALFKVITKYGNGLFGTIDLSSKQLLFLSIPYNQGWQLTVDGVITQPLKVQGGFIGVVLEKGYHEIGLKFTPYGLKEGALITGMSALILSVLFLVRLPFIKKVLTLKNGKN